MTLSPGALRQLHRLHQQLRDLRDRQDRGPKQVQARATNVVRLEQQLVKLREETKTAQVASNSKEGALKANEAKIESLRVKLNQCANNKEYKALVDQIAADEMACSVLADEILEAMEKVEALKKTVPPAEEELAKAQAEMTKLKATVADQAATIKSEIVRLEGELKQVESTLPADMREAYERAVKSMGDGALAPAEGDTCTGCNRQFTTNMLSDLMMGKIIFCKSCGCLLYIPEETKTAR